MKEFSPHFEILPTEQQKIWPKLHVTKDLGFTLYDGTALALQLGHRQSVDFDFFSERNFDPLKLLQELPFSKGSSIRQCEHNTLTFEKNNVSFSFFGDQYYGKVCEPSITNDHNIFVASLEDILALKLKVLFDRVEWKDYFDIAHLLQAGVKLNDGIGAAQAFFGNTFIAEHCLMALTYFKGLDLDKLPISDREILVQNVEKIHLPIKTAKIISKILIPSDYLPHKTPVFSTYLK